jgi:site-specific DNA-methyltransferase (adenine-specific)
VNDETIDGSESLTSCDQKIFFRRELGFRIHDTMFYGKLNFSHPEHVRYHQVVEYVFVLSKGEPRCFNPIKDKPNKSAGDPGSFGANTYGMPDGSRALRKRQTIAEFGMRTNLWMGNTRGQEEFGRKLPQPGMMPKWLARDLIISWSNQGDTVIDPHSGWGTTGLEAAKLGRNAILIEQRRESARGSREHIAQHAGQIAEATS